MESWCYSREWIWDLRAKLYCIASGKWNVRRVSLQESYISYITIYDTFPKHDLVAEWLTNQFTKVVLDRSLTRENMYLLFNSDIVNLLLNNNGGKNRRSNFFYFCSSEYFYCCWVGVGGGVGGVEQNTLFRTGWNRIFCVSGFIQEWVTQGESKISSFVSVLIKGIRP